LGLLAGLGEALVHLVRERIQHKTLFMGPEYPWQVPLADAAIFLALGLLYVLVALARPSLRSPRAVIGVFGTLAACAVLFLFEQIHIAAEAVLGLGIGIGLARAAAPRGDGLSRIFRVGVPAGLLLLAGVAVGRPLLAARSEQRRLAALPAGTAARPNILLLVLDTARAWSMGIYGYGRPTTPHLQTLLPRGTLFERALAGAPWTTLSQAVMFTGRYPTELSVTWDRPLDRTFPTLAQALADAGYATGGFVANYTQAGRPTGLDRGFLHYEDYPSTPIPVLRRLGLLRRLMAVDRVAQMIGRRRMVDGKLGTTVNAEFLGWLDRQKGRPWFAFLNYFDAHGPYLPPAPYDTMYFARPAPVAEKYFETMYRAYGSPPVPLEELAISMDAYDGGITYLDTQVDSLIGNLGRRGLLDNTIVVITSDHGELFGEHGVISHGNSLFLPVLHVPLLMVAPGRVPGGVRIPSLASLRDLPVTLLELAGVPNPGLPGHSLSRAWSGSGASPMADTLFAAVDYNRLLPKFPPAPVLRGSMRTVVLDSLQYILNGDGQEELYHLGKDSWEVRNLAAAPEYQADLARYRRAMRSLPARPGSGTVPR
jgi:arylsulfatase A-like enzyme